MPFYQNHFGMTLVDERHIPEAKFSLYFLATVPAGTQLPELGSKVGRRIALVRPRRFGR